MNYVEQLNQALSAQLRAPWTADISGAERIWFLVFEPAELRKVMAQRELFRLSAEAAGKRWVELDVGNAFGLWIGDLRYAESYYRRPSRAGGLPQDFTKALAEKLGRFIDDLGTDADTLLVLTGTEALFGICRVSQLTSLIESKITGRMLVFFPGEYLEPNYRFLDARDGWNYLALQITAVDGRAR